MPEWLTLLSTVVASLITIGTGVGFLVKPLINFIHKNSEIQDSLLDSVQKLNEDVKMSVEDRINIHDQLTDHEKCIKELDHDMIRVKTTIGIDK